MHQKSLLPVAIALSLSLTGCATNSPQIYNDQESRALNITQAAGLWKTKDYPPSKTLSGTGAILDVTTSALSFESGFGLGMAAGDALGLSLISFAFSPPSQLDRNSILAWVPQAQAADKDQAALVLSKLVLDATEQTMKAEGIDYHVTDAHKERLALFYPYLYTYVDFTLDGNKCSLDYNIFKTKITAPKPLPPFIGDGSPAYSFPPGDEVQYPSFRIGCYEGSPLDSIELARKISLALPETVFLYISSTQIPDKGRTPPMVLDHGKALLFVKPTPES
ncbi:hypothetical protein [Pseudomonas saliphila]|uniref:hypothetical protein n=1 Tax=Pseudomonas saliphila TaxID=2586906 RepID=UPI00123C2B46|nr:hypothetical protein [Pseudomonas saliphila]